MKKLLALALVVMVAGGAIAQDENMMGMFFSDTEFTDATTSWTNTFAPFNAYIVLLNATVETVGGYEVGIGIPGTVFLLSVTGPNGWTNFGGNTNHLCGYQTPLPRGEVGTVLSTVQMLYTGTDIVGILFGPATPATIPGVPVIADGANPDLVFACQLTADANGPNPALVATINGPGIVATEEHTLSGVKALFE
jgi:hypothetical protein